MRLGSVLLLVVLYGVCVVARQRRHLEAGAFFSSKSCAWRRHGYLQANALERKSCRFAAHFICDSGPLVVVYGVYVVGRQRRYLEAGVLSSSGGLVGWLRGRASACLACTL